MQRARLPATHPTLIVAVTLAALAAVAALPALMSAPTIAPSAPGILKDQLGAPADVMSPAAPQGAYPAGPTILEPRLDSMPVQPAVAPGGPADSAGPGPATGTGEARPGTADANARPVKPGPQHMELIDEEPSPQLTQNRRLPPTRRGLTE